MEKNQVKKRTAEYYDEYPNCMIRELMNMKGIKSNQLANMVSDCLFLPENKQITSEAVRQWAGGYARPDVSKLPALAKVFDCSIDYLMGLENAPTHVLVDLGEQTGLSQEAATTIQNFKMRASPSGTTSQSIDKKVAENAITFLDNLIVSKSLEQIAVKYINWTSAILNHENIESFRKVGVEVPQDVRVTSRDIKFGYQYHLTKEFNAFLDEIENRVIEEFKNPWFEAYNKRESMEADNGEYK